MSIVTPPVFTPIHDEEVQFEASVNDETLKKIILNNNFLPELAPIGTVIFVQVNQPGGGQPDSSLWQECNGSEITNPNSPIRTMGVFNSFVPDLRDRYVRGASSLTTNFFGGSQAHNLNHNHGGATGGASASGPRLEEKGNMRRRDNHAHTISAQYGNPTIINSPAYIFYIAYMKVV